jgi:hypothetical protein
MRYRRLANAFAGLALLMSGSAQSATLLVAVASNWSTHAARSAGSSAFARVGRT